MRTHVPTPPPRPVVLVCQTDRLGVQARCCAKQGAAAVLQALRDGVAEAGLDVAVVPSPCLGHCSVGPNARLVGDSLHHRLHPDALQPLLLRLADLAPKRESDAEGPLSVAERLPPV